MALVVRHAFERLRVRRVTAGAAVDNAASRRVIEANGLRAWGTERAGTAVLGRPRRHRLVRRAGRGVARLTTPLISQVSDRHGGMGTMGQGRRTSTRGRSVSLPTAISSLRTRRMLTWFVPAVGLFLYLILVPPVPDFAAQATRAAVFSKLGSVTWWPGWYGGLELPTYSVVAPAIMSTLGRLLGSSGGGVAMTGAIAAAISMWAGHQILKDSERPRAGSIVFAATVLLNLFGGRITFLVGLAAASLAVLAMARRHPVAGRHRHRPQRAREPAGRSVHRHLCGSGPGRRPVAAAGGTVRRGRLGPVAGHPGRALPQPRCDGLAGQPDAPGPDRPGAGLDGLPATRDPSRRRHHRGRARGLPDRPQQRRPQPDPDGVAARGAVDRRLRPPPRQARRGPDRAGAALPGRRRHLAAGRGRVAIGVAGLLHPAPPTAAPAARRHRPARRGGRAGVQGRVPLRRARR